MPVGNAGPRRGEAANGGDQEGPNSGPRADSAHTGDGDAAKSSVHPTCRLRGAGSVEPGGLWGSACWGERGWPRRKLEVVENGLHPFSSHVREDASFSTAPRAFQDVDGKRPA